MNKLFFYILHHPERIALRILNAVALIIPTRLFLRTKFHLIMGKKLNITTPSTFNEKLQWLKLNYHRPDLTTMVDKVAAKQYVSNIIGEDYIIPTLGVYSKWEEIDFDSLPNEFVLKVSHDSGGVYICRDKSKFNFNQVKKEVNHALKHSFYYTTREWPYKNVPRRIIIEKLMVDESGFELKDYKFTCTNGIAHNVMICYGRGSGDTKFYFFDKNWQLLRLNKRGLNAPDDFTLPKPQNLELMFKLAAKLSIGLPYVRVDLYNVNGKIYFGELTFFPDSGWDANLLPATDNLFGSYIILPNTKTT